MFMITRTSPTSAALQPDREIEQQQRQVAQSPRAVRQRRVPRPTRQGAMNSANLWKKPYSAV
ncbi:MAG TPA: hypothetical protein VIH37_02955 [Candidatus Limnocylindrales bacterium]